MVRRTSSSVVAFILGLALHQLAFDAHAETSSPPSVPTAKIKDHVVDHGVVFAARLSVAPASDSHFTSTALSVGYKYRWAIVTVNFGYESETIAYKSPSAFQGVEFTNSGENSVSRLALGASGQFAFLRWLEIKLDLIGQVAVGFELVNSSWNSLDWEGQAPKQRFRYVGIAPGIRYWLHPNCGLSLTTGVEVAAAYESDRAVNDKSTYEVSPNFEIQFLTAF